MARPIEIKGVNRMLRKLDATTAEIQKATGAALYQEGLDLLAASVKEVPVDTNTLRKSQYVAPPANKRAPVVELGYGTTYALAVHERSELKHNEGTKAHYLRDPFLEKQKGYFPRLAKRIWQNWLAGVFVPVLRAPTKPRVARRKRRGGR